MKRGIAALLCLFIALMPSIANAGAGAKPLGYHKSLLPPLPKTKLSEAAVAQPEINLTVAPKKTQATPAPAASTAQKTSAALLFASAPPAVDPDELPRGPSIVQGITSITTVPDKMTVTQNASRAIINWQKFDIGAKAEVDFSQPSSSSICLNRIFDQNPSQIFGKLQANGEIFLINQNGILFQPGSQVNLHTLIASSLNIHDNDFLAGSLKFQAEDYQSTGLSTYLNSSVVNQGTITTDNLGSVFLLAPYVENDGAIVTTAGQIGLAAGTDISLLNNAANGSTRVGLVVDILNWAGDAVNNGQMIANTGLIGMYGENVEQNGVVIATEALKAAGQIEFVAADTVSTGAGSVTGTPISDSTDSADQSYPFEGGSISASARVIVNDGLIQAPTGIVTMTAQNRVFLENGSSIDVSGVWIDEPASANTTQIQLNSEELRDYPDQKNGILKGSYITVNNLLGSSIGDISQYLGTQQETAMERSLKGGSIYINTPYTGDIIVKHGASLDFSGGGIRYSAGDVITTGLIYNNRVYSIDNAPEIFQYTGITSIASYVDSYVEGSNAGLLSLVAGKIVLDGNIQGNATAGVYQTGKTELLDKMGEQKTFGLQMPAGGTLWIGAQPGSLMENTDFVVDSIVLQSAVTPLPSNFGPDSQLTDPTTYLSSQKLSAAGLSNLQMAANTTLTVTADADISLIPGATLSLAARQIDFRGKINVPSGNVSLMDVDNITSLPSLDGSSTTDNPRYVQVESEIILAKGSQISAAGQVVDNSLAADETYGSAPYTYIAGGSVSVMDESYFGQGVISAAGSLIDVSGGYGINQKGVVTGGNAGSLTIQGTGIVLDGDLRAYSVEGNNGGKITLHAQSIEVAAATPQNPQETLGSGLILGESQLADTGFTTVTLQGFDNTTIDSGVSLSPSLVKLAMPVPGENAAAVGLVTLSPDLIGGSSISIMAGSALYRPNTNFTDLIPPGYPSATVSVLGNAEVGVAQGGSITLNAPFVEIDANALLKAPAGTVTVAATGGNLTLQGTISATGYNLVALSPLLQGLPLGYTALPGGSVTLSAPEGAVITEAGSLVDVSGSVPITTYLLSGDGSPVARTVASNPGSITISAYTLSLNGTLRGQAQLAGLQGGTLSITSQCLTNDYVISGSDFANYLGFDAMTFASYSTLVFSGNMNIDVGRSLTFDAFNFSGTGNISFQAPWIQLQNILVSGQTQTIPTGGTAQLTLSADWIDLVGAFTLSGFKTVRLSAVHDLTVSDWDYGGNNGIGGLWQGEILTSADLTLHADRIYPTTLSNFTIGSPGTVTILGSNSHNSSPIYSAGGSLTISAHDIDMEGGYLEAPLGSITLAADNTSGRVYLSSGATISTAGSAIAVDYGSLDYFYWSIPDKADTSDTIGIKVTNAPQGSVTISGNEIIMKSGSIIDVSGGGGIFAYQFQGGVQGTVDPLQLENQYQLQNSSVTQTVIYDSKIDSYRLVTTSDPVQTMGRYVIVPGADYTVPGSAAAQAGLQVGQAVYLESAPGLKAGVYTLLPEQYAFLPGAIIVTATGTTFTSGTQEASGGGYSIVAGYFTCMGTSIRPSVMEAFEVQPAQAALNQGYFNTSSFVAGNAGSITLSANTTIVDGTILGKALQGFEGGTISLSGTNAYIESAGSQLLPSDFNFNTPVGSNVAGTLYVSAGALSGQGFSEIDIGNLDSGKGAVTGTVEMEQGSVLSATKVVLSALNSITLDSGAQIITVDSSGSGNGSTSLIVPNGLLVMQPNSLVHASDSVTMTIGQLDYQAGSQGLQIDHGALNLTGQNVYFLPQSAAPPSNPDPLGLYLTSAFWSNFANFNNVNISASGGFSDGSIRGLAGFLGGMALSAKNSFTISSSAIEGFFSTGDSAVIITAPTISLLNRAGGSPQYPTLSDVGSLTLNAAQISIGEGAFLGGLTPGNPNPQNGLLIDGFSTVNFNAARDITFRGTGSLTTSGDLDLSSARVTTSYYEDANTPYAAANFTITANGSVNIRPPTGGTSSPQTTLTPGGALEIDANTIYVSGVIQMASGILSLNGASGITLSGSAQLLDGGGIQEVQVNGSTTFTGSPGGSVYLKSVSGSVTVDSNAVVDVSGAGEDNFTYALANKIAYNIFTDQNDIGVNAGLISIYSLGPVNLQGTLRGSAGYWKSYDGSIVNYGQGGSFVLDTVKLSNISTTDGKTGFPALNSILSKGGFTEDVDVTVRGVDSPNGVLTVADSIVARNFNLTADEESIDFTGIIASTGLGGGGTIQFNTGGNLTLEAASQILSPGATVFLNSADSASGQTGYLSFAGTIDVTGPSGQPSGIVHFRGSLSDRSLSQGLSDVQPNMSLNGIIKGANQVLAEGVLFGGNTGVSAQQVTYTANNGYIYDANIGTWYNGIQSFISRQGQVIQGSLFKGLTLQNCNSAARFVPGLEVQSSSGSSLTLASAWDFTNGGSNYGSWDSLGPGFLTLRAAGNLSIDSNLVDYPTPRYALYSGSAKQSWGMTLVSGANLAGANPAAIIPQAGVFKSGVNDLTIADNTVAYTEDAPLRLAAGGDLVIGAGAEPGFMIDPSLQYNVATYSGSINVRTGHDLTINGGAIESATGNIYVSVGNDLNLKRKNTILGSIRTTGELTGPGLSELGANMSNFWYYGNGGNITVTARGSVNGMVLTNDDIDLQGWDSLNMGNLAPQGWSASYVNSQGTSSTTAGLATMAGGNLAIYAGGDFDCQAGTFSPYAYTSTGQTILTSKAMNDPGNLTIFSSGNMDGRFLIADGFGELHSMANFGSSGSHPVIEMFQSAASVSSQGDMNIGAIVNPTIARPFSTGNIDWDLEYNPKTSVCLTSATGNVSLYGDDGYYSGVPLGTANLNLLILPPTVAITAAGNINILSNFALAPYKNGKLSLIAGEDISGELAEGYRAGIFMSERSDALPGDPDNQVYGPHPGNLISGGLSIGAEFFTGGNDYAEYGDPAGLLHTGDMYPNVITAVGNISDLMLFLPKATFVTAGGNISDLYYFGHNNASSDVTVIKAGGDIVFSSLPNYFITGGTYETGIQVGGPGTLIVEAGGSIDLGTSTGIQTVGNMWDAMQLPDTGATLIVAAGYSKDFSNAPADAQFFASLQTDGIAYSINLAAGATARAQQIVADARADVIAPFLGKSAAAGSGDIDMTLSQIGNLCGAAPVYIFTAGTLNAGRSTFVTAAQVQSTGIFTAEGGAINIFANGDVNVNESRVMTFMGGDITVWSDSGGINAGIGSKTAIDTTPPAVEKVGSGTAIVFTPPPVGSGIRAVTYNPDPEVDAEAPLAGNIYLFAPQGVINAGEAGIAGRNVILGAVQVLNANNIVFSQSEIGVPAAQTGFSGLSVLSGIGSVTQEIQTSQAVAAGTAANKPAQFFSVSDSFVVPTIEVRALSVFDVEPDDGTWEKTDN